MISLIPPFSNYPTHPNNYIIHFKTHPSIQPCQFHPNSDHIVSGHFFALVHHGGIERPTVPWSPSYRSPTIISLIPPFSNYPTHPNNSIIHFKTHPSIQPCQFHPNSRQLSSGHFFGLVHLGGLSALLYHGLPPIGAPP
jgi:hypothetical protein